jgi:hypothetical protein
MNDRNLKEGLRQLADQGWFVAMITDKLVDRLLGRESDPPSDELKERFLSRLRIQILDAAAKPGPECGRPALNGSSQIGSRRHSGYGKKQGAEEI